MNALTAVLELVAVRDSENSAMGCSNGFCAKSFWVPNATVAMLVRTSSGFADESTIQNRMCETVGRQLLFQLMGSLDKGLIVLNCRWRFAKGYVGFLSIKLDDCPSDS